MRGVEGDKYLFRGVQQVAECTCLDGNGYWFGSKERVTFNLFTVRVQPGLLLLLTRLVISENCDRISPVRIHRLFHSQGRASLDQT